MQVANIHATCVVCAGAGHEFGAPADAGVLLLGESGSGKSDLALRLIAMGARLVADDRCEIFIERALLHARAPRTIAGLVAIRGVGIIELPFVPQARVALAVRMSREVSQRLAEHRSFRLPSALASSEHTAPPEISIDAGAASAPAKVVAALAAFDNHLFRGETGE